MREGAIISVPDRKNSQCKGPEVGFFGAYLRKMEASVTGVGLVRG
jgi:hypothetical protein